jgi:hypothetical protein
MKNEETSGKRPGFSFLHSIFILSATVPFWNSLSKLMKISGLRGESEGHFLGKPDFWFIKKCGAIIAF